MIVNMIGLAAAALLLGAGYGKSNIMEMEVGSSVTGITIEAEMPKPSKNTAKEEKTLTCSNMPYQPFTIHLEMNKLKESAESSSENYGRTIGRVFITKTLIANASWYSVDHGCFRTVNEAVKKMQELKAKGLISKDAYVGVAVPYTVEIASTHTEEKALKELKTAKKAGVSAYIAMKTENCFKVYSGAFPNKDMAAALEKEIRSLGLSARVTAR